ncbi:hypothetical protein GPECTOR_4g833 [Gonium pectorale]|uniref:Right handed beta helix domain-containing protein n=1 Tax=Gonium pectorale TaxID=33097 RepID=A0A150GYC5_GONPE|nr:hypothetical protein GPECTOR_4g833 [Gonium pectorale]|eukprot:KXZ54763.1 hypothetical protein GPECTOR_4g833 [Gonium pectorale]
MGGRSHGLSPAAGSVLVILLHLGGCSTALAKWPGPPATRHLAAVEGLHLDVPRRLQDETPPVSDVAGLRRAIEEQQNNLAGSSIDVSLAPGVYDLSADGPIYIVPGDAISRVLLRGASDGGRTVFDCGGRSNISALVFQVSLSDPTQAVSLDLTDIDVTRCGGEAPIHLQSINGKSSLTIFQSNIYNNVGTLAGAVAANMGGSWLLENEQSSVIMSRCNFTNNTGVVDAALDVSGLDGEWLGPGWEEARGAEHYTNAGLAKRPSLPAGALSLGKSAHVIYRCRFSGNGGRSPPFPLPSGLKALSSAVVDFNCNKGPAGLTIMDSAFETGGPGLYAGCIRANGDYPSINTATYKSFTASVDCSVYLHNTVLQDCHGAQAGALLTTCTLRSSSCQVLLNHSQVVRGAGAGAGGVVLRGSGLVLDSTNLTVADSADGAIFSAGATVRLENSLIRNNSGDTYGGVSVWGGPVVALNTTFAGNRVLGSAADTAFAANVAVASGNNFTRCVFEDNAGTALNTGSAELLIRGCRFSRNAALPGALGGAVHLTATFSTSAGTSSSIIQDTIFDGNTAVAGGAVYVGRGCSVVASNCTVRGNRARSGGALLLDEESDLFLSNSRFTANTAIPSSEQLSTAAGAAEGDADSRAPSGSCGDGGGGALCVVGSSGAKVQLRNVSLSANSALLGGGLYAANGLHCDAPGGCYRIHIDPDVTFTDNVASLAGGAVYWLYEGILNISCTQAAPALAAQAWPGLLGALRNQSYTSRSLDASLVASSTASPSSAAASQLLDSLDRLVPCASWAGNAVGPGGYGPTIASSVFYHQPALVDLVNASAVATIAAVAAAAGLALGAPAAQTSPPPGSAAGPQRRAMQEGGNATAAVGAAAATAALASGQRYYVSGQVVPLVVLVFDFYGQQVSRSLVDSSVLVLCTSLNALGQKAVETANGTADFAQLRVRDKVNASYTLDFEGRTPIRDLGRASLDVFLRPCRVNEQLDSLGDACTVCSINFYSLRPASEAAGGNSSGGTYCDACPEGAFCSNTTLGGVVVPDEGYWHSGPLSDTILRCLDPNACSYPNRTGLLGQAQAALVAEGGGGRANGSLVSDVAYRDLLCAPGYWGNLCGGCREGWGRTAQRACIRCGSGGVVFAYGLLVFGVTFISILLAVRAALAPHLVDTEPGDTAPAGAQPRTGAAAEAREAPDWDSGKPGGLQALTRPIEPPVMVAEAAEGGEHAKNNRRPGSEAAPEGASPAQLGAPAGPPVLTSLRESSTVPVPVAEAAEAVPPPLQQDQTPKIFKIMLSYLQVVSLVKNTPVVWPAVLVNYFNAAAQVSSAAFSLGSLECGLEDGPLPKAVKTFLIIATSPAYWTAGVCAVWLLRAAWLRRRGHLPDAAAVWSYLRIRIIITANCVTFIQYPSVVSQLLGLFSCQELDPGPAQTICTDPWDAATCRTDRLSVGKFWSADLEVRCYEGLHLRLVLIAGLPGLLLFAAGVPLASAWWLHRNRHRLDDTDFVNLYGTLYQEYEEPYHYWESVVILRKFAVAAVVVFAGAYRWRLTLLLALGVVALAFIAQAWCKPYAKWEMDRLELMGLVATLVTFYLAMFFSRELVGPTVQVILSAVVIVINTAAIAVYVFAIGRELTRAAAAEALRSGVVGTPGSASPAAGGGGTGRDGNGQQGPPAWAVPPADIPLSFVLQVGAAYIRLHARLLWLRLRVALHRLAPRCFPLAPPRAAPAGGASAAPAGGASAAPAKAATSSFAASAVHPVAPAPAGGLEPPLPPDGESLRGQLSLDRLRMASVGDGPFSPTAEADLDASAAASLSLRAAWAAYYRAEWRRHMTGLSARLSSKYRYEYEYEDGDDGGGGGGGEAGAVRDDAVRAYEGDQRKAAAGGAVAEARAPGAPWWSRAASSPALLAVRSAAFSRRLFRRDSGQAPAGPANRPMGRWFE